MRGRNRGCLCCVLSINGRSQIQPKEPFIRGWSATAGKQKFWFGISRSMREIPNQGVCLAGPQHDLTATQVVKNTSGKRRVVLRYNFIIVTLPNVIVIALILSYFSHPLKSVTCLMWKILSLVGSLQVWHTSFCVRAVMPAMSAKPPGIFPRAYVSTCSIIEPLTFSNTYKIICNVALHAPITISVS